MRWLRPQLQLSWWPACYPPPSLQTSTKCIMEIFYIQAAEFPENEHLYITWESPGRLLCQYNAFQSHCSVVVWPWLQPSLQECKIYKECCASSFVMTFCSIRLLKLGWHFPRIISKLCGVFPSYLCQLLAWNALQKNLHGWWNNFAHLLRVSAAAS